MHQTGQPMPLVHADPERTRQVLINLIGNSLKFTEDGLIKISFGHEGQFVKVFVADTGKGISTKQQQHLFRKFEQSGENVLTRDSVQGTGLGLYISKMIMEQMDGEIKLEHSEPGKGAVFSISLPVAVKKPLEFSKKMVE